MPEEAPPNLQLEERLYLLTVLDELLLRCTGAEVCGPHSVCTRGRRVAQPALLFTK